MRVCFIAGTLGRGGAERQLFYMLRALKRMGVGTRVLCLTRCEAFERSIRDLRIDVEWVGASKSRVIRLLTIIKSLRKQPADIIQSSHFYTNIYAAAAGRLLGIPCIGAIRSDLTAEFARGVIIGTWQLRLPNQLIANSELALIRAEELGIKPGKIHFVKNVVESGISNGDPIALEERNIRVLFVGRLSLEKNPELFVRLAARLAGIRSDRPLTFEVAGDGPLRSKLEKLVAESGIAVGQFVFSGEASDIDTVYRRADILVLTSDREGTPNVILEAMAHGLPVIATRVGGVPQILDHGRGFMVEPGDLDGLVLAVSILVGDKALRRRIALSGKQFVGENHSFAYLGKRLNSIYSKLTR